MESHEGKSVRSGYAPPKVDFGIVPLLLRRQFSNNAPAFGKPRISVQTLVSIGARCRRISRLRLNGSGLVLFGWQEAELVPAADVRWKGFLMHGDRIVNGGVASCRLAVETERLYQSSCWNTSVEKAQSAVAITGSRWGK